MITIHPQRQIRLGVYLLIGWMLLLSTAAAMDSQAEALAQATFYVHWYDVGKAALDGLPGIKEVTRGFKNSREINTVTYDPQQITVEEMIEALKAADTYSGRADWLNAGIGKRRILNLQDGW